MNVSSISSKGFNFIQKQMFWYLNGDNIWVNCPKFLIPIFFHQVDLWKWVECKLFDKLGIPFKNQLYLIFFVHSNPFFSIAFILLALGDEKNSACVLDLDYHNSETYAVFCVIFKNLQTQCILFACLCHLNTKWMCFF